LIEQPSAFWATLGAEHQAALAEHGFDEVKQRQALRYFTWRWNLTHLQRSEQLRYLLRQTPPRTWLRCALAPANLRDDAWRATGWSAADRLMYTWAVRLLWEYASAHDPSGVTRLPEPTLGGPLPVYWRGRLISQDLANSALEVDAIRRAIGDAPPRSVLEVGAGYGRSAYVLLSLFPEAIYTIVDIEPAITISRWYLSQLFAPERLRFLSPAEAPNLGDASVDLVVSISSLHEMTPSQITRYLGLFDRVAAGGIVYLKQWHEWFNPVDRVDVRFDEYQIPTTWGQVFDERAPVQVGFRQAAWTVAGAR
jgi:putative sugar O-methyltransferase